jgi:hypothetical protein
MDTEIQTGFDKVNETRNLIITFRLTVFFPPPIPSCQTRIHSRNERHDAIHFKGPNRSIVHEMQRKNITFRLTYSPFAVFRLALLDFPVTRSPFP